MDAPRITSTKNPLVRRLRAVASGDMPGQVLAEGYRLAREALTAGLRVLEFAWSERLLAREGGAELLAGLRETGAEEQACSEQVLARVSSLKTPQAVVAVTESPPMELERLLPEASAALVLVADGVQDPGNLGALVRSAEAAGASGLLALEGSANPFRDKSVRGSMGSVFRLPCVAGVEPTAAVAFCRDHGLRIVVAERTHRSAFWDVDLTGPTALVVGNEGAGVASVILDAATERISIPMSDNVESLNVAVAAGVLLFEARRQRG